jgi:hypothetical protein
MKTASLLLLLYYSLSSCAQTEKINQLDSAGKKNGRWILYLDAYGEKVADSAMATYYRYTYYDHGVHIYPMGGLTDKKGKIIASKNNNTKRLDGEYKCLDKNGKIKYIHVFENGEYISYKEFDKSGRLRTFFDYTKHCDNQPHSWYMYLYNDKGDTTYGECIKKDKNGQWPKMRG